MNVFALMRRFTIRLRMLGAIAVVLGLLGLLGGAGMLGMFRIHALSEDFVSHSFADISQLGELRSAMGAVRQHEKDMIIQYEKTEAVQAARKRWGESLETAKRVAGGFLQNSSGADDDAAHALIERLDGYRKLFENVANQLEKGVFDTATVANLLGARAFAAFGEADKQLQQLQQLLQSQVDAAIAQQQRVSQQTQWLFVLAVVITVVVVVPLTWLNMVSICRPLEDARTLARAIAGGDLSQRVHVQGHDEAADLLRALQDMQDGLGALVSQVRDASVSIALASQEIATGNSDLSARTEQTASNLQQTVASLMQQTATVQQTASSAQQANRLAASASDTATQGGAVAGQAVASMQEISDSSRRIADILGLIDSIAFQTNILALNAAVEAARAGEQGRGFAVVASEVRALAGRSAAAASEIKRLIDSSTTAINGGVRHVEDAGKAMQEIVVSVQRVTGIISEINSATAEQATGIGQTNDAVGQIDRMTQQNAALVEQSAAAAESLREQAARLAQVVQQFRLADGHQPELPRLTA